MKYILSGWGQISFTDIYEIFNLVKSWKKNCSGLEGDYSGHQRNVLNGFCMQETRSKFLRGKKCHFKGTFWNAIPLYWKKKQCLCFCK